MPKSRPPYSPEFRRQMVDFVRAGRSPEDLSREFEPTAQSIGAWVAAADKQESRREEVIPALAASERDELARLRRENKQLRVVWRTATLCGTAVRRVVAGGKRSIRQCATPILGQRLTQFRSEIGMKVSQRGYSL